MAVLNNTGILAGASGAGGGGDYEIEKSLRFNEDDSAYLNRTLSSSGSTTTFTWSGWVKRNKATSGYTYFLSSVLSPNVETICLNADRFEFYQNYSGGVTSAALLRDPSAWYHLICAVDTTQNTAADRVKLYINGEVVTDFSQTYYPSQDRAMGINGDTNDLKIGQHYSTYDSDFQLAEVNYIDGQQLTASDFGEFNEDTGVWDPIKYTGGSYGTNGFYLKFNNTSDLGEDSSGNDNDWTATNLTQSVAGTTSVESGSYVGNLAYTNTATDYSDMDAQKLKGFDGNTANSWYISTAGGTTTATWTPSSAVDTSDGGFRCWHYGSWHINGVGYEIQFNINNTGWYTVGSLQNVNGHADAVPQWWTVTVPNNSLTSFATKTISGSAGWVTAAWNALEVNGEVLQENGDENTVDVSTDTPTNYGDDTGAGGEVRGNYATWNPLSNANVTYSDGNLVADAAIDNGCFATQSIPDNGKVYFEFTCIRRGDGGTQSPLIGVGDPSGVTLDVNLQDQNSATWLYGGDGNKTGGGSGATSYGSAFVALDVIGVCIDRSNSRIWFSKNNVWQNGGDPTDPTDSNAAFTNVTSSGTLMPVYGSNNGTSGYGSTNFGARQFAYTAPSGYKCLCTQNLDDTEILSGEYEGNGVADGPFVWMNAVPATLKIGTSDPPTTLVTFDSAVVDPLSNGFKIRHASTNNASGTTYYWLATSDTDFKDANAQSNE